MYFSSAHGCIFLHVNFASNIDSNFIFLVVSLLLGCIIYPAGWDHAKVREICDSEKYKLGVCHLKWAYTMAVVLVVDQLILSTLGFVLASKKPPHIPEIQFKYG